jgi:RNase P/RNase MRP subunit p30
MTQEQELIELCDRLQIALDINYLKGTVTVGRKRFQNLTDALEHVRGRHNLLKNLG